MIASIKFHGIIPRSFFIIGFVIFLVKGGFSQPEGGIILNSPEAKKSYTLFYNYLIDNCGEVVHRWTDATGVFYHAKILPNGNLMYADLNKIYEFDWDGVLDVELSVLDEGNLQLAYEQVKLNNGNYLSVGRRAFSAQEFEELGFSVNYGVIDVVLEIDGISGEIVWEWRISDHVIQERDPELPNYGIVADHPELLNMDAISSFDWTFGESFMINGMDYNEELDQIALSVRKMSEIIIIDHSTTTEEASGHIGGNSGKGGDILYRWGNPKNYGRGTEIDRFLYFQHNPKWISEGPHAGKLSCYNNGLNRPFIEDLEDRFSNVPIIDTHIDENGNYTISDGEAFLPEVPDLIFSGQDQEKFYSGYLSGAEVFENGNVFITEGMTNRLFELNANREKVWEYQIPGNTVYRAEKYSLDYEAFSGKDLIPKGRLANDTSTYECELVVDVEEVDGGLKELSIHYVDYKTIQLIGEDRDHLDYRILDVMGRSMLNGKTTTPKRLISLRSLKEGIYFIHVSEEETKASKTFKLVVQ